MTTRVMPRLGTVDPVEVTEQQHGAEEGADAQQVAEQGDAHQQAELMRAAQARLAAAAAKLTSTRATPTTAAESAPSTPANRAATPDGDRRGGQGPAGEVAHELGLGSGAVGGGGRAGEQQVHRSASRRRPPGWTTGRRRCRRTGVRSAPAAQRADVSCWRISVS